MKRAAVKIHNQSGNFMAEKIKEVLMQHRSLFTWLTIFIFLLTITVNIQGLEATTADSSAPGKHAQEITLPDISITHHTVKINKKMLRYRAEAGYMPMKDEKGKQKALIFFVSYTGEDTPKDPDRPITFAFNGGPGSSSAWVHMGGIGPKRALLSDEGFPYPPPFKYVDNENTWLEFSDLVFIDPVSTGYSRPAPEVNKKEFHGVMEDIQWVSEFIRLYVSKYQRWSSPKYLCGASYGVERASRLAEYLQDRYMMYIKGVVLMVGGLNWYLLYFSAGNDMPYVLYLPSLTAAAWYHKKLPGKYQEDLHVTLKEVEQWTLSDYLPALAKGDTISEPEKTKIIEQLSQYTGLDKTYIRKKNMRIYNLEFKDELLHREKQTVGLYDCRYTRDYSVLPGDANYSSSFDFLNDPAMSSIEGPIAAAIKDYVRTELKYVNDLSYEAFAMDVYPWNWGEVEKGYLSVMKPLHKAMTKNKYLQVMIVNGYYDLVVPYFAIPYTVSHLGLPGSLRKNIIIKCYPSGHFMYGHRSNARKLKEDVFKFYTGSIKQ